METNEHEMSGRARGSNDVATLDSGARRARRARRASVLVGFRLLLVLLSSCAFSGLAEAAPAEKLNHFITRRGDRLIDGDREYRWVSVNAPDSFQIISNYVFDGEHPAARYRLPDDYELRDCVRSVRQMGGRVLRTFVITCSRGPSPHAAFDVSTDPATPNEAALRVLDRLLQVCSEEGVRLMIPLVAYNSGVRGDWKTYGDDFWNVGSAANRKFKDVVRQVLTRTNAFTGRSYLEDKAIIGWHTGNELVIGDDPARRAWLHDFAAYVKSIDPNHLLIDGRNRPTDILGKYDEFAADPNIDAVSYHTYVNLPQADTPAGTLRVLRDELRGKIPLIVTEIAMYTKPEALRALLDEVIEGGTVGANWWALRFHNRDGGFYKHSDRNSQFEDLNWPGFANPQDDLPEIDRERELWSILADYAGRIANVAPFISEKPEAPTFLPARDVGHLTWQGSAGANGYDVQRAPNKDGPWSTLAANVPDNLVVYAPQFCDATAEIGATYFYRVIARNAAGESAPSNVVGPFRPDRRWVADELFDQSKWHQAENLQIDKAYAHTAYLEDIALVRRADATKPAKLAYEVPGVVRGFSITVFEAQVSPKFFLRGARGERTEVAPRVVSYDGGKRARYVADLSDAPIAGGLEVVLPAEASPQQAMGRVEISWIQRP